MMTARIGVPVILAGALLAFCMPALAQTDDVGATVAAPEYGSRVSIGSLSNGHYNTPESDGRPGVHYFVLGVQAFRKGDYRHAVAMYKVAGSWAYKPAEYNLGIMYYKGQGVPVDRARGAAWMVLAAERGDNQLYEQARDLMVTSLSKAEFARTDAIWNDLKPTYGDAVALRRAKARWAWVRTHQTGTRVGGVAGELSVGVLDAGHKPRQDSFQDKTSFGLMQGGSVDGSIAYRQFHQSDDPYDRRFERNPSGRVTVEPLQPIRTKDAGEKADQHENPGSSSSPGGMQRSA